MPVDVRKYAQEKTSKLLRYYDSINQVEVIISCGKGGGRINVEIIVRAKHGKVFIVNQTGGDVYLCIDSSVRKLERQLKKRKGKERDSKHVRGKELM